MQFSGLKLKLAVHRASCLDRQILFAGLRIFSSPSFLSTACHLKDLEANFLDVFNLCVKICSIYEQMHKNDGIAVFDVDTWFQQQRGLLFVEQLKSVETVQISLLLFHPPTKNTQTSAQSPLSKLSRTCRRLLAIILFTDLPWNLSLSHSQKRYFSIFFLQSNVPFPIDTFGILAFLDNLLFNNSAIKAVMGFNFFEGATSSSADRLGRVGKTQHYVN